MSSSSKKEKDINKSLDRLYNKDKNKIISWLNGVKIANKTDGKISGLLNDSKIQIITATEDGQYNLILKWIAANIDKFADYDFKDIPDSSFISLKNIGDPGANTNAAASRIKTFSTPEDVQRWCNDPEKHPTKGTPMSAMEEEYFNIYQMAFKIMRKNKMQTHDIRNMFPKNHILFGDIDLLYYTFTNGRGDGGRHHRRRHGPRQTHGRPRRHPGALSAGSGRLRFGTGSLRPAPARDPSR